MSDEKRSLELSDQSSIFTLKRIYFILTVLALGVLSFEVSAQRVTDGSYRTVAHIKPDGTIQDGSYRTLGHIRSDGTVQDSSYRTIGHIKSDGTVQDEYYRTIGHAEGIPFKWAAFYFFFSS